MREMQQQLVNSYKAEIEELRRQRDFVLNQGSSKSDYIQLNQDFKSFNEGNNRAF